MHLFTKHYILEITSSCLHIMVLRIPNSCLRIIRTKRCIAVFTCFPPSSDKEHRCYDTSGSPGSDTVHPGVSRGEASGSVPSRVLPKSESRPAGLTGRLVYWRRDSERDGERGEPEGEPSLNETGIQVFFCCCCCFVSTLDPSFLRFVHLVGSPFPTSRRRDLRACVRVFFCKRFTAADHETSFVLD